MDQLNIDCLLSKYKGSGTSAYPPRMLLKILFYAYLCNIYSCRKIAKALEKNIYFMWLSGNSHPDFRTINRFQGEGLKEAIKALFTGIVLLLQESGYVSLDLGYIDGTKIESASNRYTFVWRGSVEKNKSKLEDKIPQVLSVVEQHTEEDKQRQELAQDSKPTSSELLGSKVKELNSRLDKMDKIEPRQVQ